MRHHHEHFYHFDIETREEVWRRLDALRDQNDLILDRQEAIMLDTSKLLESARKASTENASLRAVMADVKKALDTKTAELAAAIAANDPAAMAQAQADINEATRLLDADDAETAAALGENVATEPPPAQPEIPQA